LKAKSGRVKRGPRTDLFKETSAKRTGAPEGKTTRGLRWFVLDGGQNRGKGDPTTVGWLGKNTCRKTVLTRP